MKIHITLKDPDGVYDCLNEPGIDDDTRDEIVSKYLPHSEYVHLVYDTETKEMTVTPRHL